MTTLSLGGKEIACAGTGVDGGRFDNDTSILDELLDVDTRVGVADLSLLSGVEPNFSFADACNASGEALL